MAAESGKLPDFLHHALTQHLVFSGEQLLYKIVTALIRVARGAGRMMIDSRLPFG